MAAYSIFTRGFGIISKYALMHHDKRDAHGKSIYCEVGMECKLECKSYPFDTLGNYIWADVVAFYNGKWLFSKHKERTTWETQGGHIEVGETPLEAAKRELYEESGAIEFDIEPLCDYSAKGSINGVNIQGNSQVFIAHVHVLGEIPRQSEMERVSLFDSIPDNLTYLDITNEILPIVLRKRKQQYEHNMEQFSIPSVGGIIEKEIDGIKNILMQTRIKANSPCENGLIEIPAGKIRAFENIFCTLKREIKEETGLEVVEIQGENSSTIYEGNSYKVVNFTPFSCSQNLIGEYPIMVFVFICKVKGELLPFSDEAQNYKWTPVADVKRIVEDSPHILYSMHVDILKKYVS